MMIIIIIAYTIMTPSLLLQCINICYGTSIVSKAMIGCSAFTIDLRSIQVKHIVGNQETMPPGKRACFHLSRIIYFQIRYLSAHIGYQNYSLCPTNWSRGVFLGQAGTSARRGERVLSFRAFVLHMYLSTGGKKVEPRKKWNHGDFANKSHTKMEPLQRTPP
jgi:hypothetical protein